VDLPAARLARLSLPEDLRDAVMAARRITAHGGKRRQLQYVGRLMRALDDAQVAALRQALAAFTHTDAASTAQFHTLERWRARLLDDEAALTDWLQQHPQTDAQRLRALIRKARRERSESLPPAAFRELFQLLKQACET
jgi:ribosome-associated protein